MNIKSLFCKHPHISYIRNTHGDEIIHQGYKRTWVNCNSCNKDLLITHYISQRQFMAITPKSNKLGPTNILLILNKYPNASTIINNVFTIKQVCELTIKNVQLNTKIISSTLIVLQNE